MCAQKTTVGPPPVPLRTPLTFDMSSTRISVSPSFSISARMYCARACSLLDGAGISTSRIHSSTMADERSSTDCKAFFTSGRSRIAGWNQLLCASAGTAAVSRITRAEASVRMARAYSARRCTSRCRMRAPAITPGSRTIFRRQSDFFVVGSGRPPICLVDRVVPILRSVSRCQPNRPSLPVVFGRSLALCAHPYAAWRSSSTSGRLLVLSVYVAASYAVVLSALLTLST